MSSKYYEPLLQEIQSITEKYGLGQMLKGFTPLLINVLIREHIQKVIAANSYESCLKLINDELVAKMGSGLDLSSFITAETDRRRLYQLCADWRVQLLAELGIQYKSCEHHLQSPA